MIIVATPISVLRPAPGVPYDSPGIAGGVPQIPRSNEYPAGLLLGAYKERLTLPGRRSQVRTEKTHPGYRVHHDYWPYRK